jgi:uncharacterized membrane protein YecN with MAPEG domain
MNSAPIVSRYAGLLALLFLVLTVQVIRFRRENKVILGSGGHNELERRRSAHSNFAEFVPLSLFLFFLLEARVCGWVTHALCASLTLGRMLHAWGISKKVLRFRFIGMLLTLIPLIIAALLLLFGL